MSFIVWPSSQAQPAWNDPRYGGSVVLPAGSPTAGVPGWYIGHLKAGQSMVFTNRSTSAL